MDARATVEAAAAELARTESTYVDGGATRGTAAGAAALAAPPEELIDLAIGALREAARQAGTLGLRMFSPGNRLRRNVAQDLAGQALRRKLPWTDARLAELLDALAGSARVGFKNSLKVGEDPVKPVVSVLEKHYPGGAPRALHGRLERIARLLDTDYAENARVRGRIVALLGDDAAEGLPASRDPWTAALLARANTPLARELLKLAVTATASRPAKRFTAGTQTLLADHGAAAVGDTVAVLLGAACAVRGTSETGSVPPQVGDALRGLAWIGAAAGGEAVARALGDLALAGWVKVPDSGPTCSKAANAALAALGERDGGAAQLGRVRAQLKPPAARAAADAAIASAAQRLGLPPDAFEERSGCGSSAS
jgi:hypothetical protein